MCVWVGGCVTAKRSAAMPRTKSLPPVAPYSATLPICEYPHHAFHCVAICDLGVGCGVERGRAEGVRRLCRDGRSYSFGFRDLLQAADEGVGSPLSRFVMPQQGLRSQTAGFPPGVVAT